VSRVYPEVGDWAVCKISGFGGRFISFGEWANGAAAFTTWDHALVYVGDGMVLQAEPGGAQLVKRGLGGWVAGDFWSTGIIGLTDSQRAAVPTLAASLQGIGYSFLDYVALAGHRTHVPDLPLWPEEGKLVSLQTYIKSTHHQICSQLVDYVMAKLGCHLFDDGRWPGYVTPYDLGNLLWKQSHGGLNYPARTTHGGSQ
jgi:hypothetical protein